MRVRELKHAAGKAKLSVWPPSWGGAYARGDTFAMGEQGTLTGVKRFGERLSLTIDNEGRAQSGSLERDAPPTLDQVEKLLQTSLGRSIKEISELEV